MTENGSLYENDLEAIDLPVRDVNLLYKMHQRLRSRVDVPSDGKQGYRNTEREATLKLSPVTSQRNLSRNES